VPGCGADAHRYRSSGLETGLSAIWARTCPSAVSVRHDNGRVSVYTRQLATLLKTEVRRSHRKKLLAVGIRSNPAATRPRCSRRLPPRPTAAEQVRLLASIGLSDAKFNRIRVFFGGALNPTASLLALRQARASLMTLPAMEVSLLDTGAHLAHISLAVEGRLADLWSAGLFIERPAYDPQGVAIPDTHDYEIPSNGRPSNRDFCPPADMRDIHISIGLETGGDPSSVKVVMGFLNYEHPNRLGKTLLVAVCPETKDMYPEVAAILAPHVAQLLRLSYTGVVVSGHRREVRVIFNSDFPAITNTVGHKGHSASMPCPCCLGMK